MTARFLLRRERYEGGFVFKAPGFPSLFDAVMGSILQRLLLSNLGKKQRKDLDDTHAQYMFSIWDNY